MSEQKLFSCKDYKKVFSDFTLHVLLPSGRMGGVLKKMGSVENWVRKNVYLCR